MDLTYLETAEGWLFLAIVLDLHSRKVVGWAFAQSLHTALPLAALHMALTQRRPARGLLHHSDRRGGGGEKRGLEDGRAGGQYASAEYRRLLQAHGLEASMSRTGNPYDNAAMERLPGTAVPALRAACGRLSRSARFFSTLKIECLHGHCQVTRIETQAITFDYIESFYNQVRLHSALGYQSPVDLEKTNH